jgi:hypothetical protein
MAGRRVPVKDSFHTVFREAKVFGADNRLLLDRSEMVEQHTWGYGS